MKITPKPKVTGLRERREAAGLTRETLAYEAGLSVSTIARIEAGQFRPRFDTLEAIALVLQVRPADLIEELL